MKMRGRMKRGMMGRRFEEEIVLVRLIKGLALLNRSSSPHTIACPRHEHCRLARPAAMLCSVPHASQISTSCSCVRIGCIISLTG
jgi:hypothetical protein